MRTMVIALCAAAGLAACTTPEQQLAADQATCASYGFNRGTDAFANCLLVLDQQRKGGPPRFSFGVGVGTRF
ncbi:MAG: hypothetical protein FJX64_05530 [Alphaproteobacteria bacterium]|nr:hypothetical protein [Alphaproteobacteria bacterium]